MPPTNNKACCLLVLRVPGEWGMAITALNFSQNDSEESLDLRRIAEQSDIKLGGDVVDILSDEHLGRLPKTGCLTVKLPAMTAKTLIIDSSNP